MNTTTTPGIVIAKPALDLYRRKRGLSIRGLAAAAGLPPSTVAHLFAATSGNAPAKRLRIGYGRGLALARALEVPMGEVFTHPNGDTIYVD